MSERPYIDEEIWGDHPEDHLKDLYQAIDGIRLELIGINQILREFYRELLNNKNK